MVEEKPGAQIIISFLTTSLCCISQEPAPVLDLVCARVYVCVYKEQKHNETTLSLAENNDTVTHDGHTKLVVNSSFN